MAPQLKITKEIGPWPGEEPPAQWREPENVRDAYDTIRRTVATIGEQEIQVGAGPLVVTIDGEKFDARALQRIIGLRWAMEQCGPAASVDEVVKAAGQFEKFLR